MVSEKFTILELTDLALRYPEVGAVNFNILHTVLTSMIRQLGLEEMKPPCRIENETMAQMFITMSRMADKDTKRKPSKVSSSEEIKARIAELEGKIQQAPSPDEDAFQKVLEAEDLVKTMFDEKPEEPAKVMAEVWRAININRRVDAAETGMSELCSIIDDLQDKMADLEDVLNQSRANLEAIAQFLERIKALEDTSKVQELRIEDCNEQRAAEVGRLEDMIKDMKNDQEEAKTNLQTLEKNYDEFTEKVAYTKDLEELKTEMSEDMEDQSKAIKKLIREVEESLVKKEDFIELETRVENLEDKKVNREELGRLLDPGFLDNFLDEQANIRRDVEELKERVNQLEENMESLRTMIDEEVLKPMEAKFAEVHAMLDTINEKLALLDPDEINDSFANLEEQIEKIGSELERMKSDAEQFQKEARISFNKLANFEELLKRLEQTKLDKSKINELLEMKADKDLLWQKMDRSEFVAVMGEIKDDFERLTIQVKINEEEMNQNFTETRHQLSLKMYTEDFIIATEPIRNRIRALIYEIRRVKEIALEHLFPDAPGIVKCMSCKRGAHLAGPKYMGDIDVEQEVPPSLRIVTASSKTLKSQDSADSRQIQDSKSIDDLSDLDSVPIPPPDTPRETNPLHLPVLFAKARPNIGLPYPKLRKDIDEELATYFATRPVRPVDGKHTLTSPQQRGLKFIAATLPQPEKKKVLLKGIDKGIYRGALDEDYEIEEEVAIEEKEIKPRGDNSDKRDTLMPSTVSLHTNSVPSKSSQKVVKLPSNTQNTRHAEGNK